MSAKTPQPEPVLQQSPTNMVEDKYKRKRSISEDSEMKTKRFHNTIEPTTISVQPPQPGAFLQTFMGNHNTYWDTVYKMLRAADNTIPKKEPIRCGIPSGLKLHPLSFAMMAIPAPVWIRVNEDHSSTFEIAKSLEMVQNSLSIGNIILNALSSRMKKVVVGLEFEKQPRRYLYMNGIAYRHEVSIASNSTDRAILCLSFIVLDSYSDYEEVRTTCIAAIWNKDKEIWMTDNGNEITSTSSPVVPNSWNTFRYKGSFKVLCKFGEAVIQIEEDLKPEVKVIVGYTRENRREISFADVDSVITLPRLNVMAHIFKHPFRACTRYRENEIAEIAKSLPDRFLYFLNSENMKHITSKLTKGQGFEKAFRDWVLANLCKEVHIFVISFRKLEKVLTIFEKKSITVNDVIRILSGFPIVTCDMPEI